MTKPKALKWKWKMFSKLLSSRKQLIETNGCIEHKSGQITQIFHLWGEGFSWLTLQLYCTAKVRVKVCRKRYQLMLKKHVRKNVCLSHLKYHFFRYFFFIKCEYLKRVMQKESWSFYKEKLSTGDFFSLMKMIYLLDL